MPNNSKWYSILWETQSHFQQSLLILLPTWTFPSPTTPLIQLNQELKKMVISKKCLSKFNFIFHFILLNNIQQLYVIWRAGVTYGCSFLYLSMSHAHLIQQVTVICVSKRKCNSMWYYCILFIRQWWAGRRPAPEDYIFLAFLHSDTIYFCASGSPALW